MPGGGGRPPPPAGGIYAYPEGKGVFFNDVLGPHVGKDPAGFQAQMKGPGLAKGVGFGKGPDMYKFPPNGFGFSQGTNPYQEGKPGGDDFGGAHNPGRAQYGQFPGYEQHWDAHGHPGGAAGGRTGLAPSAEQPGYFGTAGGFPWNRQGPPNPPRGPGGPPPFGGGMPPPGGGGGASAGLRWRQGRSARRRCGEQWPSPAAGTRRWLGFRRGAWRASRTVRTSGAWRGAGSWWPSWAGRGWRWSAPSTRPHGRHDSAHVRDDAEYGPSV